MKNEITLSQAANLVIAEGLGWKAFSDMILAPHNDLELQEIIKEDTSIAILLMKAWGRGKTAASLAA